MPSGVQVVVLLVLAFALCWIGKHAYRLFHPGLRLDAELTAKDNLAFAVPMGAYYLGILLVMGAPLSGPSRGDLVRDGAAVIGWGLLAVGLLNLASLVKRRVLFAGLDLGQEILTRRNLAAGTVLAGLHVASALVVLGALSGEGGLLPAVVFWLYAQVLLTLAAAVFLRLAHEDIRVEVLRDNQAVALALAGILVAMGNILRVAIGGSFDGWRAGLAAATGYALAGLVLLFLARWLLDWLLLPGVTIRQEVVEQAVPNVGVGYLEGLFYLGTSFLITWAL
jgi:uncharacterized membrane protein YjfL (UPF0719 family)